MGESGKCRDTSIGGEVVDMRDTGGAERDFDVLQQRFGDSAEICRVAIIVVVIDVFGFGVVVLTKNNPVARYMCWSLLETSFHSVFL